MSLPEVALLEIFDFYVDEAQIEAWQTLVHVCRKWRNVAFGSPRRLNLRLLCKPRTPVKDTLDVWPLLPIIVENLKTLLPINVENKFDEEWDTDTLVAALNHKDRIHKLRLFDIRSSQLENVLPEMHQPFPALTELYIRTSEETVPVVPASFLGASAPRLRSLALIGIHLAELPKLHLSATHLVSLCLWRIPYFRHIKPEAMVTYLSVLTSLESLYLGFESPRCCPDRRRPPPRTRTLLPALTEFMFKGVGEYLEDFVARIDTPLLNYLEITFFHRLIFDTPQLTQFIGRTPELKANEITIVEFSEQDVSVRLEPQTFGRRIKLNISCRHSDWQLSSLAQIFDSSFHAFVPTVERLYITPGPSQLRWQEDIEGSQWLELLYPFTAVKDLYVPSEFMPRIAPALQELVGGSALEVLPALQNLFVWRPHPSGTVPEAIEHFVASRQLSNRPVSISPWR